jgi:hypothetical protein
LPVLLARRIEKKCFGSAIRHKSNLMMEIKCKKTLTNTWVLLPLDFGTSNKIIQRLRLSYNWRNVIRL